MSTLETKLTEVEQTLVDERNAARRASERGIKSLRELIGEVSALEGRLLPNQVVGAIRSYRYGPSGINHPVDAGMPCHQFELECGNEVWLHICIGSDKWDEFVAQSKGLMAAALDGMSIAQAVEGKRVTCVRDAVYGRYVPLALETGRALGTDRDGETVYEGSRVLLYNDGPDKYGKVVKTDGGSGYEVRREDGVFGGGSRDEEYGGSLWLVDSMDLRVQAT